MIIFFTIVILFATFSSGLFAQDVDKEKINGAFGIKLGQIFEPSSSIGTHSLTDGTQLYEFIPENRFRSISKYFVGITPESHKVYSIWGGGNMDNNQSCKKEQAVIMSILFKKYIHIEEDQLFKSLTTLYGAEKVNQGDRYIITKCEGFVDVTLQIRYEDGTLGKQAEAERIMLESENSDSSGL